MIYSIYCKNLSKCHNVPQHSNKKVKKKEISRGAMSRKMKSICDGEGKGGVPPVMRRL
jgi:hypothetical protein